MDGATALVGMLASLTSFVLWVPQGRRVWRARRTPGALTGIAMSTQAISLTGNVLWSLYAVGIGSFWLGAPAIVNVPILTMTLVVLRRHARAAGTGAAAGADGVVPSLAPQGPSTAGDVGLAA